MSPRSRTHILGCLALVYGLGRPAVLHAEALRAVQNRVAGILAHPALRSASVGFQADSLTQGDCLLAVNSDSALMPASNVKLLTTTTALELLGPEYRYCTRLLAASGPKDGVIEGHLVLEAAADPVAADALGQLAAQLGKRGVRQVGGDVLADGPAAEQTKQPQPAFAGALGLCRRLGARGIAVSGVPRVGEAPGGAVVLADLSSPPLKNIIAGILKPSDNELAERLLVSLPWAAGRPELTPMELVGETWADRGLYLRPMRLADGSGLSRRNLMSPAFVVALLTYMHEQGRWSRAFEDALPLAGVDGTLAHRMRGTAAERQVQAKTGTLRGVSALSGYVRTQGEETLVFSIIMNNLTCPVSRARRMQDQICAALTELDRTGDRKN